MDGQELYHYGVKGMKWGVRRARKQLSKGDAAGGTERLKKERAKAVAEVEKLKTKGNKLNAKFQKTRTKARKTYFTSIGEGLTESRLKKARKLDRKLQKNLKKQVAMNAGIKEIDRELISSGKDYVNKKVR